MLQVHQGFLGLLHLSGRWMWKENKCAEVISSSSCSIQNDFIVRPMLFSLWPSSIHVWWPAQQQLSVGLKNFKLYKQPTHPSHSCMIWPADVCYASELPEQMAGSFWCLCCAASSRQTWLCPCTTRQDGQITRRLKLQPESALIVSRDGVFVASAIAALDPPLWENRVIVWYHSSA